MSSDRAFLGVGWAFPPAFTAIGKGAQMVSKEEDVRQALTILLGTVPGERVMHPTYGCGLKALVFEGIDEGTVAEIGNLVERAVLFHEPRITLETVDVRVIDELEGHIEIHLVYTIRGTNTRSNMVYPFYLLEGTSLRSGHEL